MTPSCMTKIKLSTSDADLARIHLTKAVVTQLNSDTEPCVENAEPETCFKNEITSLLKSGLNCKPFTLAQFALELSGCDGSAETQSAIRTAETKAESVNCEESCTKEKFNVDQIEYLPKQNFDEIEESEFRLDLLYDDMKVTLIKEFHIYDGIDMVMAVGGILAFFLGFSLLSVLLDCVDVVYRACGNQDDAKISVFKRTFRQ